MNPALIFYDLSYSVKVNLEYYSKFFIREISSRIHFFYLWDIFPFKFCHPMFFAFPYSSLRHRIGDVVLPGPNSKMVRIYASRVVARMKYLHSWRYFSDMIFVGKSMSLNCVPFFFVPNHPIAMFILRFAIPYPTGFCFLNFLKKSIRYWYCRMMPISASFTPLMIARISGFRRTAIRTFCDLFMFPQIHEGIIAWS